MAERSWGFNSLLPHHSCSGPVTPDSAAEAQQPGEANKTASKRIRIFLKQLYSLARTLPKAELPHLVSSYGPHTKNAPDVISIGRFEAYGYCAPSGNQLREA